MTVNEILAVIENNGKVINDRTGEYEKKKMCMNEIVRKISFQKNPNSNQVVAIIHIWR